MVGGQKEASVLGFADFYVFLAYILVFLSAALCVIYGAVNWNREGDVSNEELEEEKRWLREEIKIDEELSGGGKV